MDCPCPIKSVPQFYPTWLSRTRPSMGIQRSEGLGSRLGITMFAPLRKKANTGTGKVTSAAMQAGSAVFFFFFFLGGGGGEGGGGTIWGMEQ